MVQFTSQEVAELVEVGPDPPRPLGPEEVAGKTLKSVISAGTELAMYQGLLQGATFPLSAGYAAAFVVQEVGEEVTGFRIGDLAFCMGPHRSFQRSHQNHLLKVPPGLAPEFAAFARLMGVSMTTLTTTEARPPAKVVVSGLGPVGHMAARIFDLCGYEVFAVDPSAARREIALQAGLERVYSSIPLSDPAVAKHVSLVVECSGHEQAVLDACNVVQKRGEVALVGVPWKRRTELLAHEVLYAVFHNFVVLRSGWEWEIPRHPTEFHHSSVYGNTQAALRWLAEGKMSVEGLFGVASPHEAQRVYQDLLHSRGERLAVVFDWC